MKTKHGEGEEGQQHRADEEAHRHHRVDIEADVVEGGGRGEQWEATGCGLGFEMVHLAL